MATPDPCCFGPFAKLWYDKEMKEDPVWNENELKKDYPLRPKFVQTYWHSLDSFYPTSAALFVDVNRYVPESCKDLPRSTKIGPRCWMGSHDHWCESPAFLYT